MNEKSLQVREGLGIHASTCQWFNYFPGYFNKSSHQLIFGSGSDCNTEASSLKTYSFKIVTNEKKFEVKKIDESDIYINKEDKNKNNLKTATVKRVRVMPQNHRIIASISCYNDTTSVDVFEYNNFVNSPLKFEPKEIFGGLPGCDRITWNPDFSGRLLGNSNTTSIGIWEFLSPDKKNNVTKPTRVYIDNSKVLDIAWNKMHSSLFGSVNDNGCLKIWDVKSKKSVLNKNKAHESSICSISFNYHDENVFSTGSDDQTIAIWDLRKMAKCIHSIKVSEPVRQVLM